MRTHQTPAIALTSGPSATRRTLITVIFVAALAIFLSGNRANAQAVATAPVATAAICQIV